MRQCIIYNIYVVNDELKGGTDWKIQTIYNDTEQRERKYEIEIVKNRFVAAFRPL